MRRNPGKSPWRQGFTLIEVLIALAIAALSLSIMFGAIGGGIGNAHIGSRYQEALSRARSHLAAVTRLAAGTPVSSDGDDGGGYRWSLVVKPAFEGGDAPQSSAPAGSFGLYRVAVTISWSDGLTTRAVTLDTLRVGGGPKQTPQRNAG